MFGEPLLWKSVKAALSAGTRGDRVRFERLSYGVCRRADGWRVERDEAEHEDGAGMKPATPGRTNSPDSPATKQSAAAARVLRKTQVR